MSSGLKFRLRSKYSLAFSFVWGRLKISRWTIHSCTSFRSLSYKFPTIFWTLIMHKANKTATNNMKMGLNYDSFLVRNTNREFASFAITGTTSFESFNKEYTKFTALRRGPRKYVAACFFFCMTVNNYDWEKSF